MGIDGIAWSSSADASCPPTVSTVTDRPSLLMKPSLWKYSSAGNEKPASTGLTSETWSVGVPLSGGYPSKGGAPSVRMKADGGVDDLLFECQTHTPEAAFNIGLPIDKT